MLVVALVIIGLCAALLYLGDVVIRASDRGGSK